MSFCLSSCVQASSKCDADVASPSSPLRLEFAAVVEVASRLTATVSAISSMSVGMQHPARLPLLLCFGRASGRMTPCTNWDAETASWRRRPYASAHLLSV